jgi:hypothetical protein
VLTYRAYRATAQPRIRKMSGIHHSVTMKVVVKCIARGKYSSAPLRGSAISAKRAEGAKSHTSLSTGGRICLYGDGPCLQSATRTYMLAVSS